MTEALLAIVAAPAIGSFLSTLVVRLPAGGNWLTGRSACPHCRRALRPAELVPVLSWLWSRGRCRRCGAPIGLLYPGLELGALGIALWSVAVCPAPLLWWSCGLGWALLALAAIDWRSLVLPDGLTLPLLAAGLAWAWFWSAETWDDHLWGVVVGYGSFVAIERAYRAGRGRAGLGRGDAKLLAAGGAWLGWQNLPSVVLTAALFTLAVIVLLRGAGRRINLNSKLPFGPALSFAIWITWLYGSLQF